MKKLCLFKFRLMAWERKITVLGVILSWKDGVIDIMDQDRKRRTIPEDRVIKIERVGREPMKQKSKHIEQVIQLELFQ